jgi:hypothetical protein
MRKQRFHSHKLFVLVDRTLSRSQQAVQACHAVAEFVIYHGSHWEHQSLVLLAIDGEEELDKWREKLSPFNIAAFYETYQGPRLTAIACHGCDEAVSELPLL